MTRYQTSTGVTLDVQQIPRGLIDAYVLNNPAPEPPTMTVQVFGGVDEQIENPDDPTYQASVSAYNLQMAHDQLNVIAEGVTIVSPMMWGNDPRREEMQSLGIDISTQADYLRYIALSERADLTEVLREILYLSTVTDRGIEEAKRSFAVQWKGIPLKQHPNPPGDIRVSAIYQARMAATKLLYTWEAFCELGGPAQSAVVAQHSIMGKIQYLSAKYSKMKNTGGKRR